MKKIPEVDRFYIVPGTKGKTHLGFLQRDCGAYQSALYFLCFRGLPMEVAVGPCGDSFIRDCTQEDAEYFDQFYNEVNCPTCLKIARGNDSQVKLI